MPAKDRKLARIQMVTMTLAEQMVDKAQRVQRCTASSSLTCAARNPPNAFFYRLPYMTGFGELIIGSSIRIEPGNSPVHALKLQMN